MLIKSVTPSRSRVAIRACSSPCAVPRRAARLSRDRSLSRRENAETLVRSAFLMKTIRSLSRSFSLRVVGVLYPHTPLRGCYTLALPHLFVCSSFEHMFCQGTAPKNFCLRGYYTPTPPLRGCYTLALPVGELFPHTPKLLLCCLLPLFCRGTAPKIFYLQRRQKFFAPLTTTKTTIINTRAERFPAPRLSCYMTRRTPFGGLFSPPNSRRGAALNNWGRGKNVKFLNNFAPSPIV